MSISFVFPFEKAVFYFQRPTTFFYDTLPAILMWMVRACLLSMEPGGKKGKRVRQGGGGRVL